jgi:argonaute-like protein implicated in RNA metabolism and viral defense
LFAPRLVEEPYLEFRNGLAFRGPRKGILTAGPYDFGKIPEINVVLLVHHKLKDRFERFWQTVDSGEPPYRGFTNTFGSKLTVLKESVFDATTTLKDWLGDESVKLPQYTVAVVCLPDSEIEKDYFGLKTAVKSRGPRAQLLRETTLGKPPPGYIALGLGNGVYAKAGGTPWQLRDPLAPGGLFIGIGFAIAPGASGNSGIYYGVVEVFDKFGKLVEVDAQAYSLQGLQRSEGLYIPTESLAGVLNSIIKRLNPLSITVHKSGRFHKDELKAFESIEVKHALVHLEFSNSYRVYDDSDPKMAVFRGLLISDVEDQNRGILMTTGNVNDVTVQRHLMGTPRPIEVNVTKNTLGTTLQQIAEQVVKLTKLNWNSLATEIREPITIKYSNAAAGFASRGYKETFYDIRDLI